MMSILHSGENIKLKGDPWLLVLFPVLVTIKHLLNARQLAWISNILCHGAASGVFALVVTLLHNRMYVTVFWI